MLLNSPSNSSLIFRILERHDAVIVEKRSEDNTKIEKLWVATAFDAIQQYE
jgi:hypothetical protein